MNKFIIDNGILNNVNKPVYTKRQAYKTIAKQLNVIPKDVLHVVSTQDLEKTIQDKGIVVNFI